MHDRHRRYRETHRSELAARNKAYREANPEKFAEYRRRYNERAKVFRAEHKAARGEFYRKAYEFQEGRCGICGRHGEPTGPGAERRRVLLADHCHQTGTFRGLLCGTCNSALGMLGDTVEGVQKALTYLRLHRRRVSRRGVAVPCREPMRGRGRRSAGDACDAASPSR